MKSVTFTENCPTLAPVTPVSSPSGTLPCGAVIPIGAASDCNDPVFAAQNPSICGSVITLVLKPQVASVVVGGHIQYSSVLVQNGVETPLAQGVAYSSSNSGVGSIDGTSGNSTGVAPGVVTITAMWHGMSSFAQLTVVNSCADQTADFVIIMDNSKSMSAAFSTSYSTKLKFAIGAARSFASFLDYGRTRVAIVTVGPSAITLLPFTNSPVLVDSTLAAVTQTSVTGTFLFGGLQQAIGLLSTSVASRKAIILLSDGEDRPGADTTDHVADLSDVFTGDNNLLITVGVRAFGTAYALLNEMASGGFFLNAYDIIAANTITNLDGFAGYTCAGTGGYISAPPPAQIPDPTPLPDLEPDSVSNPSDPPTDQTYSFTASYTASCSGTDSGTPYTASVTYVSHVSGADAQVHAIQAARVAAFAGLQCCGNRVVIPDNSNAVPYPACFQVNGFTGTITGVRPVLTGFTHGSTSDVTIILVGPHGQACTLMSAAGGAAATNGTILFDRTGSTLPTSGGLVDSTIYAPHNYSPSGPPPLGTLPPADLTVFNGVDPNGTWQLYVTDSVGNSIGGSILAWSLILNGLETCGLSTAPANLSPATPSQIVAIGSCPGFTFSSAAAWSTGDSMSGNIFTGWTYSFPTRSFGAGSTLLSSATINLVNQAVIGLGCYYELRVFATTSTGIKLAWLGRKPAAFGASPVGSYSRSGDSIPIYGLACSNSPGIIDIQTP